WDPDAQFLVPESVSRHFDQRARGAAAQREWEERFGAWSAANPELAAEWADAWAGRPRPGVAGALPVFEAGGSISTRKSAAEVMQAFGPYVPTMIGGAADLVHSTFTQFGGDASFTPEHAGRNVAWGVREHGMGAAVNGLALHGGIVKPYGSTFFVFTDYMRPPIRLSALMNLGVVWIFSHDSVAVGEDGPTHQPIAHLAAMRAIPNLTVIRPADANEAAEAWAAILEEIDGPVCLVLSRQNVPTLDRGALASSRCRAGSCSSVRTPTTARRCCRRASRRSRSRRRRRSGGRAGSTPRSGSTASAPRARATRCSPTSASPRTRSPHAYSITSPSSSDDGSGGVRPLNSRDE